jgi:hypothetical protein
MKDQPYPLTLILRRLKMGEMKEDLEISLNHTSSADGDGLLHSNCVVNVDEDADSVIYILRIAEGVTVKPVDWRRFAYDHKAVNNLIQRGVTDNVRDVLFEPVSDELIERIEYRLTLVLADMISIFDTISVNCELRKETSEIYVTIEGEYKNGKRETMAILAGSHLNY